VSWRKKCIDSILNFFAMNNFFASRAAACCIVLVHYCINGKAQHVGIGTNSPDTSAIVDISNTNKGVLIPRTTPAIIGSLSSPGKGLMFYDTVRNQLIINTGNAMLPDWQNSTSGYAWSLTGNAGTQAALHFIGTTDNHPIQFKINNQWSGVLDSSTQSTYFGYQTGKNAAGTVANTAFGVRALGINFKGTGFNTALGSEALKANTTGYFNTAVGVSALINNQSGAYNVAVGVGSLGLASVGTSFNTAVGKFALLNASENFGTHTATNYNVAVGSEALKANSIGIDNVANGYQAGYNSFGTANTLMGSGSMFQMGSGDYNTADGFEAMRSVYTGYYNTVLGSQAFNDYTVFPPARNEESQTTAVGYRSLYHTDDAWGNTALGYLAGNVSHNGWYNLFIGAETDVTNANLFNVIVLGHGTTASSASVMRVGNPATTSIGGPVGWSTISDKRVKTNIRADIPGLALIMELRPVTYNINVTAMRAFSRVSTVDNPSARNSGQSFEQSATASAGDRLMEDAYKAKEQVLYTGFVAQEVDAAAKKLQYNFNGVDSPDNPNDLYALRYDEFVVPLVKAAQELSAQGNQLKKNLVSIKAEYQNINQRLNALALKVK
jgi:hypothetical protein